MVQAHVSVAPAGWQHRDTGQDCCASLRQARRGSLRRGAKTRQRAPACSHTRSDVCPPQVWPAVQPWYGTRCHRQGRLTGGASFAHPRCAARCGRCSLPHPCQRSHPALLSCGCSHRAGPWLRPVHFLYVTSACISCILFVPFRISPEASVALLICTIASRSCSSDPADCARLAASGLLLPAGCAAQCQGSLANPLLLGWHAGCLQVGCGQRQVAAGLGAQPARPEGREELGGAVTAAEPRAALREERCRAERGKRATTLARALLLTGCACKPSNA